METNSIVAIGGLQKLHAAHLSLYGFSKKSANKLVHYSMTVEFFKSYTQKFSPTSQKTQFFSIEKNYWRYFRIGK